MGNIIDATDETFQKQIAESRLPVIVDFWAPWCGPCRQVSRIVDEIARDHASEYMVMKVDIDVCPTTAEHCGILSVPTLALFIDGEIATTIVGGKPKAIILKELNSATAETNTGSRGSANAIQ